LTLHQSIFPKNRLPISLRWEWLDENFHNPAFIGIIRNGYAVTEGTRRRAIPKHPVASKFPNEYPIELCGKQWVEASNILGSIRPINGRYLEVRYEDLAEDPLSLMADVWRFLELDTPKSEYRNSIFKISSYNETIKNMNENSIARLSKDDIKSLNPIIGQTLTKYGYDIIKP
jgi:hypothetical protein